MEIAETQGDVSFSGDQIGAFCDLLERLNVAQSFDVARLRTATRISRHPSLGQSEWRVTLGTRAQVVVPIAGLSQAPQEATSTAFPAAHEGNAGG